MLGGRVSSGVGWGEETNGTNAITVYCVYVKTVKT